MPRFAVFSRHRRPYRGSAILASSGGRVARVLVAVGFVWLLTSWAMGWWSAV